MFCLAFTKVCYCVFSFIITHSHYFLLFFFPFYLLVIGRIRLAIGQSNLFINERFRQFNGLIEDCEAGRGEKKILVEDLAGFWDMIYYQVEDLKSKYAALEELRRNGWLESSTTDAALKENGGAPSAVAARGKVAVNGACKSNGSSSTVYGSNGIAKRNGVKTSSASNGTSTNGGSATSNGHVKKAAPVRSNIREFLKSKRKEVVVVKDPEAPVEPIIEFKGLVANGKSSGAVVGVTNGNGALANSTAHHLNGH